ncbi:MAG: hypothetical protein ACKPKO_64235, partial [Candidatus Fonsibacter sp.]
MINRCRCVEDPNMDLLNGEGLNINSNYNFWKYAEVLELNQHTVANTRPEFLIEDGAMRIAESGERHAQEHLRIQDRRATEQAPQRVHRLPPGVGDRQGYGLHHPIPPAEEPPVEDQATTAAAPQRKNTKVECRASSLLGAKGLSQE